MLSNGYSRIWNHDVLCIGILLCMAPASSCKTRATQARRDGDLETAQQILGHSSKQMTERHYADVDLSRAEANALQFG